MRASFDRQGMMSTLGVEVTSVEPGKVEMSLRHDDRFTQQHGFLHAGAVTAVLTVSFTTNLMAPAAGQRFVMTGQVVRAGRTLVVCHAEAVADGAAGPSRSCRPR